MNISHQKTRSVGQKSNLESKIVKIHYEMMMKNKADFNAYIIEDKQQRKKEKQKSRNNRIFQVHSPLTKNIPL